MGESDIFMKIKCISSAKDNLIKTYKNIPVPAKASFFFVVCSFVQKGIALLSTPIFTRLLTTEEYGRYTVYQSWYAILLIFCTMYVEHGAFNKGILKYEADKDRFVSSLLGLTTSITIILWILYTVFSSAIENVTGLSAFMINAMFLHLIFLPAFTVWSANERFHFRYKKLMIVTLLFAFANPSLGIIAIVLTGMGAEARIASIVVVQVVMCGYFYQKLMRGGKCYFSKEYWKYALCFCIPMIPHYLSESILQQSDRLMINHFIGADKAAIYSIAYTISMMVTYVSNAINQSFMPYLYKGLKGKAVSKIADLQKTILIIVLGACILVIALAPEIVIVFATNAYKEAIDIIPPVAMSVFFIFLCNHFSYVEMYFGKNIFITCASIVAAMINVVLNYIFIPKVGYVAAGYTTLISYIVLCIIHYCMYCWMLKRKKMYKLYEGKFIWFIILVAMLIMVMMTMTYHNIIIRYALVLTLVIITFVKRKTIINLIKRDKE